MDFYKDFPERSDAGTATTPDGGIVAGSDKLNDNDYALVGANSTGSNSQGKGYKVKFSSIYNYLKSKFLGDSGMEATSERRGLMSSSMWDGINEAFKGFFWNGKRVYVTPRYITDMSKPSGGNKQVAVLLCKVAAQKVATFNDFDVIITGGKNNQNGHALSQKVSLLYCPAGDTISKVDIAYTNGFSNPRTVAYNGENFIAINLLVQQFGYQQLHVKGMLEDIGSLRVLEIGEVVDVSLGVTFYPMQNNMPTQSLAASYIAERYSIDEEQALTRRMIANDPTVVEQFEAYNAYCEECKTRAKEELANQPQVLPADSLDAQQ